MTKRKALPKTLEKKIYQKFNSSCPFCGGQDVETLQVHHIVPYAETPEHKEGNLVLCCANCHQKIERGEISEIEVHLAKNRTTPQDGSLPKGGQKGNTIAIQGDNHGEVKIVNIITNVKQSRGKKVENTLLSGSIGANLKMKNYIKYLIDRYHKFKRIETKEKMNYPIFYNTIKRKFGAKWSDVEEGRFDELQVYIKDRINKTIQGKNNNATGKKSYHELQDH